MLFDQFRIRRFQRLELIERRLGSDALGVEISDQRQEGGQTEESGKGTFPAVLHCFTGSRELALAGVALGFSVSFSGILTFKKSDDLRAIAAELPADRILVETDAPYLAPGKFRGKRNEPAYVVEVAKVLAETRGVSSEEIARQTTENFFRLFNKVPRSSAAAA